VELLPAGAVVLDHLMQRIGLDELTVSEWALREGIVLSAIGRHDPAELDDDPRALRRSSVLSLCRRSSWRQRHARQSALLAGQLFDVTTTLHGLGPDSRELLELAALLHDIGEHISRSDHDRHTAYLIENGGLRGFDPSEICKLAVLGRYHVRGNPKASFEPFAALDESGRAEVLALTALLRVADALDASHASRVRTVDLRFVPETELVVESLGDAELEMWTVRRKKELFERVFNCTLALRHVRLGPERYDPERAQVAGLG